MSRINRYNFAKMLHSDYVIILVDNNRYVSYNNDLEIIKYIKLKKNFKVFDKYKINYLVLDNLDIIMMKEYDINNYEKYLKLIVLNTIIKHIGNNLIK